MNRERRPRGGFVIAAGIFLASSAGAYVPSSRRADPPPPPASAPPPHAGLDPARDFDRLLAHLDGEERRLGAELAELEPKLEMVRKRMVARGRQYYRSVRAGMLPIGGGFDALVDHATRVERLRAALTGDIALERELRERQATAAKELRRVRAERAPLLIQREAMKRARSVMEQAEERREAFDRAFGKGERSPHLAVYGASADPLPPDPGAQLSAMRGRLSFPLTGRAEVLAGGASGRGLRLRASHGTTVRAVHAGRIAFAGEHERGLTVLVDHGEGYFSLYGNLQRLDVRAGETIAERGSIGRVERNGGRPAELYFELRQGDAVLDAAPWLGL